MQSIALGDISQYPPLFQPPEMGTSEVEADGVTYMFSTLTPVEAPSKGSPKYVASTCGFSAVKFGVSGSAKRETAVSF